MTLLAWALPFDFEEPRWLWLCVLIPILVAASFRSLAGLDPVRRVLALLVRSALVLLVAVCLAGIQSVRRSDALTIMFLMDRSHSVEKLADFQEEFIRQAAEKIPPEDRLGLIDFARAPYVQQLPMKGGLHLPPGRLPPMPNPDRTDVASALRRAMALFPPDAAKRIVLMSDGNDNMGDIIGDLSARRCVIQENTNRGHLKVLKGLVPLAEMFGYATAIRSLSQGRATYTMEPHSYQEVPKQIAEKIVAG